VFFQKQNDPEACLLSDGDNNKFGVVFTISAQTQS
jgi:hypothetical protein